MLFLFNEAKISGGVFCNLAEEGGGGLFVIFGPRGTIFSFSMLCRVVSVVWNHVDQFRYIKVQRLSRGGQQGLDLRLASDWL